MKSYFISEINEKDVNGHSLIIKNESIFIDGKEVILENYKIRDFIGSGANGVVLKAKEKISDRNRAIKIWISNDKQGKSNLTRGKEEIKKISKLEHKNIVRYYATGESCGYKYCVLEEIDGVSIRQYIKENNPNLAIRYDIMTKILEGLRYAHEQNIYHGDLHGENILIEKDGTIKILDFGTSCFNKKFSMARDSRLLYETTMEILGQYIDPKILDINKNDIQNLSPRIVRLIMKAASKITVLLEFLNYGVVDTIIEDISLFSMIVPFFNLRYLSTIIGSYKGNLRTAEGNGFYFMERLIYDGSTRILKYGLYPVFKDEVNRENIYDFYMILRDKFSRIVNNQNREEYIYANLNEAKIFNGELYASIKDIYNEKRTMRTEEELEYNEIRKVLESNNLS